MDWEIWRVLSSEHFSVASVGELLSTWTMEDLVDAHMVLDMFAELEQRAHQPRK